MDETDDFIDEPEIECLPERRVEESAQLWSGFGDDVAQRFLRLRGILDDDMQDAALERYAQRKSAPRVQVAIAVAVRSTIMPASPAPRVHTLPMGAMLASSIAR